MNKKLVFAAVLLAAVSGCTQEQKQSVRETKEKVKTKVETAFDVAAPVGKPDDPKAREQERFDERWRQLESFRQQQQQQAQAAAQQAQTTSQAPAPVEIQFVQGAKETFKKLTPDQINAAPVSVPIQGDRRGPSVLKTQVFLDRVDFSVGALDGRWGKNSAISLWWYQRTHGLDATGAVDEATFRSLAGAAGNVPPLVKHTLTEEDVKGPFVTIPDDVYEKEKLDCLCYETKKEKLAELFHTTQDFLDVVNPDVDFGEVKAGDSIWVPNVREPLTQDRPDIAKVVVSIAGNTFNAFDTSGNLIFHAPTTLGSTYDPSPNETVHVVKVVNDPHFHYQPTLFHEVPDSDPEAHLSPGPNSPVGVVWIALSKEHFGVHGTSDPDSIGYASSHGCVRLTNWDAREVAHRIQQGVPVAFVDTRKKKAEE